jgi:broad specificity phosphatase PhoE
MKSIEFRRHAARSPSEDALSAEGRAQAEAVGRTLSGEYAAVFVSPARRAAQTAEVFLEAAGRASPATVEPGLASALEDRWRAAGRAAGTSRIGDLARVDPDLVQRESQRLAGVAERLFDRVPDGARALAVGHTPLIEAMVYGLLGREVEPLGECEGVLLTRDARGDYTVEELRLGRA